MKSRLYMADVLFIPYNYLINEEFREKMGLDLQNKIILVDEAHNIASAAQSAYNLSLKTEEINTTIK